MPSVPLTRCRLILLCSSVGVPIVLSALRFLPFSRYWRSRLRAYLVYPSAWGRRWLSTIRDTHECIPTRGQLLLVIFMIAINAVVASTGHFARLGNDWRLNDRHGKFIDSLGNRMGVLALANLPLSFLFAGRNNLLLYLTNWSHITFVILHRWISYIATTEAIIHSIIYLWTAVSEGKHSTWVKVPAWYTGVVGVCSMSLLIILSTGFIRRRSYEIFLLSHIGISVAVLCGVFYHLYYLTTQYYEGYPLYVCTTAAIWVFDRLFRIARIVFRKIQKAQITIVDDDYIRVDIPDVNADGHAYLYFPTLTWRPWESHPFSVAKTTPPLPVSMDPDRPASATVSPSISITSSMSEKKASTAWAFASVPIPRTPLTTWTPTSQPSLLYTTDKAPSDPQKRSGITFYVRTLGGVTRALRAHRTIPVLVEGSYGKPRNLGAYPTLLCMAGGVGITAVLPYMHQRAACGGRRTKLYWGCRSQALADALALDVAGCEAVVAVGRRLDCADIVQREVDALPEDEPVAVIVSGPKGMADEVRAAVCAIGRTRRGEIRFLDECFGW